MSWNTSVVTNAGVDLLNESLAGHTLTIESAVGGAGTSTEEELKSATDVAEPKQAFKLIGIDDFEQGKRVGIQITNKGVAESYVLHQIGAKAHLEYEMEAPTLLFVLQDDRGVEIPTEAENPDFLFEVYAVITISNEANIVVNVSTGVTASVTYVDETVESAVSEHSADKNAQGRQRGGGRRQRGRVRILRRICHHWRHQARDWPCPLVQRRQRTDSVKKGGDKPWQFMSTSPR